MYFYFVLSTVFKADLTSALSLSLPLPSHAGVNSMRLLLEVNPEHTEIEQTRAEAQTTPCPKPAPYLIPAAFILEERSAASRPA